MVEDGENVMLTDEDLAEMEPDDGIFIVPTEKVNDVKPERD